MRSAAHQLHRDEEAEQDQFVYFHHATWADYQRILTVRGERSAPRITYLEGVIEIMSPALNHEVIKSTIGRLVEVWCLEHDIEFMTSGSWTLKSKKDERGAEPDESYIFGEKKKSRPDLAIEVVWTSGGINKLEVYRKLGVREVWWWERGVLQPYALRGDRYVRIRSSKALPGIDLTQLASFLDRLTTSKAIRAYRAALRSSARR